MTELITACVIGDVDGVNAILKSVGSDSIADSHSALNQLLETEVKVRGKWRTPLMAACACATEDGIAILRTLLSAGADPAHCSSHTGAGPINLAVQSRNVAAVEILLEANPGVATSISRTGSTPLWMAANIGSIDIFQPLMDILHNPDEAVSTGATLLHIASQWGHIDIVKSLIEANAKINIFTNSDTGPYTPLMVASQNNHAPVVRHLLLNGADVNAHRPPREVTSLHLACQKNSVDAARVLIEFGANIQHRMEPSGATPLIVASSLGHLEMVDLLLEAGVSPNCATLSGNRTPLDYAAVHGYVDIARSLIRHRAPLEYKSGERGSTALHVACTRGKASVAKVLLEAGADAAATEYQDNTTPLFAAYRPLPFFSLRTSSASPRRSPRAPPWRGGVRRCASSAPSFRPRRRGKV